MSHISLVACNRFFLLTLMTELSCCQQVEAEVRAHASCDVIGAILLMAALSHFLQIADV